jgi:hypothetical protein
MTFGQLPRTRTKLGIRHRTKPLVSISKHVAGRKKDLSFTLDQPALRRSREPHGSHQRKK